MKRAFLVFFLMTQPVDAAATCHRFSHWAYPWPQRCGVAHLAALQRAATVPPAFDEDAARHNAIEKLKSELQAMGLPNKEKP